MTMHIQNFKNFDQSAIGRKTNIESVPCKILADCDAKVTDFFRSSVKSDTDETFRASFRGYPLRGKEVDLPKGYVGVVLHESMPPLCENEARNVHIINKFKSLRYWNWDMKPSKNDKIVQAMDWIDIAEALHSPITDED